MAQQGELRQASWSHEMLGNYYAPSLSQTLVFIVMAAVLLWRPAGLFGREEAVA